MIKIMIQSTPDNWNLQAEIEKSLSYRQLKEKGKKTVFTAQWTFWSHLIVEMLSENWKVLQSKSERNVTGQNIA